MKKTFIIILLLLSIASYAQPVGNKLKIGDKAPELKVTWIKGEPIESFENDKLYLVEFWATWCGPCKQAMPHLSQIARDHRAELTVIGVNIWERKYPNGPYDQHHSLVKEFTESMGDAMDYLVAMDNNDLYMVKEWMKAAGRTGIPSSFLVKEGKIAWIGHPNRFDPILEEVLAGTYDPQLVAKSYEQSRKESERREAAYKEMDKGYSSALKIKDYQKALEIVDNALPIIDPSKANTACRMKFSVLLEINQAEALEYAKRWSKEIPNASVFAAAIISKHPKLSNELYDFAIEAYTQRMEHPSTAKALMLEQIAYLLQFKGESKEAKETLQKAIELAKESLAAGEHSNIITERKIEVMQQALNQF